MSRLKLHGRVHLTRDEKITTSSFVRCPEDGRWSPVEACRRCAKCEGVDAAEVSCAPDRTAYTSTDPERAPIAEVMDADVLCVDADATADSVRRVMAARGAPIGIVVDSGHHAIGVCSRTDLAQPSLTRRVGTFMTPFVITLLDGTTVGDAIALVVERDLHHVPVLSGGHIVGLVTPRAIIAWLAQNLRRARTRRRLSRALRV